MAGTSGCVPDYEVNVFGQLCKPSPRPTAVAGTSGSIPDFEVNVFGQLCKSAPRPSSTAMAGTSGCVPDFEVNVFGQLCRPVRRLSSSISSSFPEDQEPELDADADASTDVEPQANAALLPPSTCTTTALDVPTPDHISELFQQNQLLIQGLLVRGDVDTFIASVRDVFKEVRRDVRRTDELRSPRGGSVNCFVVRHYEQAEEKKEEEDAVLAFRLEEWRRKGNRVCSHVIM